MTTASRPRRLIAAASALMLVVATGALAAKGAEATDPERQGDVFKRIFSYDKVLRRSEKIIVIVVSQTKGGDTVNEVASVFREKGLFPAVVTVPELTDDLTATLAPESTVIYVMPGVAYDTVTSFAAAKGFLSVSGVPTLAEAGHVSVSVNLESGRPEIVVNLARLQSEHHELSSELLNLARVIR